MEKESVVNKTKIRMEEITPFDENVVSSFPNIGNIIEEVISECIRSLFLILPVYLINSSTFYFPDTSGSGQVQIEIDELTGYFILPDDFIRLSSLKMSVWQRAVTRAISEESPEYLLQTNIHTRGGIAKPVCVIRQDSLIGGKVLEYYSVIDDDHSVERATYIPLVDVDEVQEDLIDPLCWMIASKAFQVIEEPNLSEKAFQRVQEFILTHTL